MGTVTAIIPTHDRAALVERALRSVLAQERPVDEILILDDGSTDDTLDRLRKIEESEPRLRVLSQPNSGVSAARNRAIEAASGDWLAFLDSDDEWQPDKIAAQLEELEEAASPFLICHTDEIWIRNGRRVNPRRRHAKRGGFIFQHCLPLCAISPSSVMIHRRIFEQVGCFDETFPACEDYDLWLRICSRYPVLYVDRPLTIKYGGHEDQLSCSVPALDRYRIRALAKILDTQDLDSDDHEAARQMLLEKIAIYRQGVVKRGRHGEAVQLDALVGRFQMSSPGSARGMKEDPNR